jgi:hypothetical protein
MRDLIFRSVPAAFTSIGKREFESIGATSDLQEDGIALVMSGGNFERLRGGPLRRDHEGLIGKITSVRTTGAELRYRGVFPASGVSPASDEACGLLKSGFLNHSSIGFAVDEAEPIISGNRKIGIRAIKWTAYEISLVACPMDIGAVVTSRAARSGEVLNVANADKLRKAYDAAEVARGHIADVLAAAGSGETEARYSADFRRRQMEMLALQAVSATHFAGKDFDRRQRQLDTIQLSAGATASRDFNRDQRRRDVQALSGLSRDYRV